MELVKLGVIFFVIILFIFLKRPLFLSMIAATVATWLLFQIPVIDFLKTLLASAISWQTISVLLLFYFVSFLQRMLDKRGGLMLTQQSLNGLFQSRRITASFGPLFLGLLPSAGVVPICGEIVETTVGDSLSNEEKAFVTSYYRHIPESFLPTYATIFIPLSLTQGKVKVGSFLLAMLPMVALLLLLGYLFYLRKVPKQTDVAQTEPRLKYLKNFLLGIWPLVLTIFLILAFNMPVYAALITAILLFFIIGKFRFAEIKPFFKEAFDKKLLLSMFFIMLFKDVLASTGVIEALPAIFSKMPIPDMLVFSLLFFVGTLVGGSQAIGVIGTPLVFSAIPDAGLAHFVLLMGINYAANQIAPTHVCVPIAAEHFNVSFWAMVKKTLPVILTFYVGLFLYYMALKAIFPAMP